MSEALIWSRETPYHVARVKGGHYSIERVDSNITYFELKDSFVWPPRKFASLDEAKECAQLDHDCRVSYAEKDAVDLIQDLMDTRGLTRADIFSAKSRASEIMNRKRPMTLALIRKLHFQFGLPAAKLIAPYRSNTESDAFIQEKLKDPNWAPYCLVCDTMGRMTKTKYGFRCDGVGDMWGRRGCGNTIGFDMRRLDPSTLLAKLQETTNAE